ncbi:MAG TPA: methylated-DNA--[protein]-cysteine S-methyltransferase [Rhizomicrobium sp.]|nr:methylated-DNA--[protein]-cysteine S-methyltransferase [Rhizomicrobium sp.]
MILDDAEAGRHYRQMGRAIRFLADHYQEQPTLDEAASAAGLSPFHFQRLFTRYVGISPKNFVGHLTLDHAKSELANGASVLEAALDAGLSGPSRLHDLAIKIEAMTPGEYARGGEGIVIEFGFHPSPFGTALLMTTGKGLCGLAFADDGEENAALADMKARWPKAEYREAPERTRALAEQVFDAARGNDVPIGLHLLGTPWQIKVWEALLAIPEGRLTTYKAIAKAINKDSASRAVGTAVGRNPISYLIPCHRVLGSDGALHGYHWGLSRKRAILAVEAARRAA